MKSPLVREPVDTYVDLPPDRRTLPKAGLVLAILVTVLVIVGAGVRGWYQRQTDPAGPPGAPVAVVVPKGTTVSGMGGLLADKNVIGSATLFRFWVRSKNVDVQAGSYTFRRDSSFQEALAVLRKGPGPAQVDRVTIPEGLTLAEMVDRLVRADPRFTPDALRAAIDDPALDVPYRPGGEKSAEGMLFPSTYDLGERDTAATLVRRMAAETRVVGEKNAITAGVQGAADAVPQLDAYGIWTVASLIQAESGNAKESPKIARVIYNRLLAGQPLGIDATSRYLSQQTGKPIDFQSTSPYNTRRQVGLPPTPIGAPGEAAIEAALHPVDGPWLYYVLEAKGRHVFTASEAEFNQKKQECAAKGLGCG